VAAKPKTSESKRPPVERLPPNHDPAAEIAVVGAVATDGTGALVDELRQIVKPEHFFIVANRLLYEAMLDLHDQLKPVDVVTLANHLQANGSWSRVGSVHVARALDETPAIDQKSVLAYAEIVKDKARLRALTAEAQRIEATARTMSASQPEDVQEFLEQSEASLGELAHADHPARLVDIASVLKVVFGQLQVAAQQRSAIVGVPSGYNLLDRLTTGLHDGELTLIAGRPGTGKTAFALSTARNVAGDGYAVPVFSLEVPAEQLGLRLLAAEARIDMNLLRAGKLEGQHWSRLTDALTKLCDLPLYINDDPSLGLLDLRACVRRLNREIAAGMHKKCTKHRIGVAVIDYLQLMGSHERGRSREEEVAALGRGLKQQAKAQGVPYIAVCGLNRESEKRPDHHPRLSDLRESGALDYDADNVIFVHRPSMYDKEDEEDPKHKGIAELILAKQRNGPTGLVRVAFMEKYTRFDNLYEGDNRYEYDSGREDPWDGVAPQGDNRYGD